MWWTWQNSSISTHAAGIEHGPLDQKLVYVSHVEHNNALRCGHHPVQMVGDASSRWVHFPRPQIVPILSKVRL
jgi:hypothetical protein